MGVRNGRGRSEVFRKEYAVEGEGLIRRTYMAMQQRYLNSSIQGPAVPHGRRMHRSGRRLRGLVCKCLLDRTLSGGINRVSHFHNEIFKAAGSCD